VKRIFLIGFMGAGKSTLGPPLAKALEWSFTELDHHIEMAEGASIPDIFSKKGETYFREAERKALRRTILLEEAVIACGGGTPCFFDNIEWMNANGMVIWLKEDNEVLAGRLAKETTSRPLLKGLTHHELVQYVTGLSAVREKFYSRAGSVVESPTVEKILDHIK